MSGARLAGVTTVVPPRVVLNDEIPGAEVASKITGVKERRWVKSLSDQKDMELLAARKLLAGVGWHPSSVGVLVHVTQTPYLSVPACGYELHASLGLNSSCVVVPVNWSCAGYVMGLWLASNLVTSTPGERALVIVGDSTSTICAQGDRATQPLFGDAVSATALSWSPCTPSQFILGSDGTGAAHLRAESGDVLRMSGHEVLSFVLANVPNLARQLLGTRTADYVLMHQANKIMVNALRGKICSEFFMEPAQVPCNIETVGNCSSASIPLLMTSQFARQRAGDLSLTLLGFGAGWAWAGANVVLPVSAYVEGFEL